MSTLGHTCTGSCICLWRKQDIEGHINPECPVKGHLRAITALACSPDGTRIVSGSHDNRVKIWDAQTGAEVRSVEELWVCVLGGARMVGG